MQDEQPPAEKHHDAIQFRLSTIFILTLVATVLAAYLSPLGNDLLLAGITSTVVCGVFAFVVGSIRRPLVDRVFWAIVVAAMMQAVSADVDLLDRVEIYAWPITAGTAAVFAARREHLYVRMLLAGLAGGLCFAAFATQIEASTSALVMNVVCACIGGALLAVLIAVVGWLERRYNVPQPWIGMVMVLSAIGFAIVAPQLIPGW